jgi:protein TonB
LNFAPPQIQTVQTPPPPAPPPQITVPAPPAAPPPPRFTPKAAAPKGNPGSWVSNDDYPTRELQLGQEGITGFRLTIGTDGKVTNCEITRSSGSAGLDKTACDLLRRRARFSPSTDGDGNPVTGSYTSQMHWLIPKD